MCKAEKLRQRTLPRPKRQSYRNALLRVTIAFVVTLALLPRLAAAASPAVVPVGAAAADSEPPVDQADSAPANSARSPAVGALPAQPFADAEATDDAADAQAEAGEGGADGDDNSPTSLRALSCLEGEGGNDQDGARRGVQKRDFMKRHRFEISALGGYYASDALSSTYLYGGALSFFPSEDLGLELLITRNPVRFRLEEAFTSFDRERHFQSGAAWNVLGAMLWAPVHAKLRWNERHITHADLLLLAGGGETLHESVQGLTFQVGAAIKLYLARYVSLRLDVRDLMVPQEVLGQGRTTHNVITMFGLCAWVPG